MPALGDKSVFEKRFVSCNKCSSKEHAIFVSMVDFLKAIKNYCLKINSYSKSHKVATQANVRKTPDLQMNNQVLISARFKFDLWPLKRPIALQLYGTDYSLPSRVKTWTKSVEPKIGTIEVKRLEPLRFCNFCKLHFSINKTRCFLSFLGRLA